MTSLNNTIHNYYKSELYIIGNAAPGSAGGGATPSAVGAGAATPATLATAIALVPAGLAAIAVFPPYANPRQIPAVSVIFAETPIARYVIEKISTSLAALCLLVKDQKSWSIIYVLLSKKEKTLNLG